MVVDVVVVAVVVVADLLVVAVTLYLVVINNAVLRLMELMMSLCGGVGWLVGLGLHSNFMSTPSLTDLDWTGV